MRRRTSFVFIFTLLVVAVGASDALAAHAPNDPLYPETSDHLGQWGLRQINAAEAWHESTGAGSTIAIVDSGVDLGHQDLQGKLLPGATFLACGGPGSCGNGDWESGPASRLETKSTHGTHVAGIAAAVTNNGIGVAGVAPDAKILPVKVLDEAGGNFDDAAAGIRWAADRGADVINLSFGPQLGIPPSELFTLLGDPTVMDPAIEYAMGRGAVVVVAAGNDTAPYCADPGLASGGLCVAATDPNELRTLYTNAPVNLGLNAVSAPGGAGPISTFCGDRVISTVPAGTGSSDCGLPANEAYDEYSGTSMAAPHVSGQAALLASLGCTAEQTTDLIKGTARLPLVNLHGIYTPLYGYGIVDAAGSVYAGELACDGGAAAAPSASSSGLGGLVRSLLR